MTNSVIAPADRSPIVIGGVGGSGTRLIAQLLGELGVVLGGQLNEALDNLWFSLLFVRRSILLKSPQEIEHLAWLFTNAMRGQLPIPQELMHVLSEAADHDRGPALTQSVLKHAKQSMLEAAGVGCSALQWGWKQPNSHVMTGLLDPCFPTMKYIYVVRNGLDMAFSANQNQLKYFWGDILLDGDVSPCPGNSLRYWVASYRRILAQRELLGDRLYLLNYDQLCTDPQRELKKLDRFLGFDTPAHTLAELAKNVAPPASMGRYQQEDLSQFCHADVEFVSQVGFPVDA